MSTIDYNKKKVDELQELLKTRSLPHTGKKAELVARLQQDDTEKASTSKPAVESTPTSAKAPSKAPASTSASKAEDEIDWEDDAAAATTDAGAAAIAAGGQTQPLNPTAVPNQAVDTDPSKTSDLKVKSPAEDTKATTSAEPEKPAQDFTAGVQATSLDEELAKRKKRAARFGITETDEDALKAIERAKRFGAGTEGEKSAVKGLDEALPERKKRGRGTESNESGRNGKRSRVRGEKERGAVKDSGVSEKDKAAAEARKKRFATA